mmetsp:Transcript_4032/g.11424  ORF Transcript_4032/g.11424 Transcript_4032/m.11424 type:complete len:237 (-) Transcript_4032:1248-1958(-)
MIPWTDIVSSCRLRLVVRFQQQACCLFGVVVGIAISWHLHRTHMCRATRHPAHQLAVDECPSAQNGNANHPKEQGAKHDDCHLPAVRLLPIKQPQRGDRSIQRQPEHSHAEQQAAVHEASRDRNRDEHEDRRADPHDHLVRFHLVSVRVHAGVHELPNYAHSGPQQGHEGDDVHRPPEWSLGYLRVHGELERGQEEEDGGACDVPDCQPAHALGPRIEESADEHEGEHHPDEERDG